MTDQIQLPPPVGSVAPWPDVVDWISYEPDLGTDLYEAVTVRRLIAEAEERATSEANRRAHASWARMAEKMVANEREACASIAEDQNQEYEAYTGRERNLAYQCAAAIRARTSAPKTAEAGGGPGPNQPYECAKSLSRNEKSMGLVGGESDSQGAKTAAESCIQGLRNVIAEASQ